MFIQAYCRNFGPHRLNYSFLTDNHIKNKFLLECVRSLTFKRFGRFNISKETLPAFQTECQSHGIKNLQVSMKINKIHPNKSLFGTSVNVPERTSRLSIK